MGKEERRIEILQAASRVFYLNGFEGTKMEDVAKEAGIGKGTVYEYFESKQQLFEEMVAYNRNLYIEKIRQTIASADTFRESLIALARYQTNLVQEHLGVFNTMANSKIMAREVGALILEQNIRGGEIIKELIMEAMNADELREDIDPEIAAAMIMGTINQFCGKKVMFLNADPDDLDYEQIADTILRGIGA